VTPVDSGFWVQIAIPLAAGAALSLLVERLLQPAPFLLGRSWRSVAAHLGLWTLAFCFELALCQRPYFAALLALALMMFLVLVNNAKVRALREPFVFQDFEYFTDALKHPRFYLPYLGIRRALAGSAALAVVLYLGFTLEPWLPDRIGLVQFGIGLGLLAAAGAGLLWLGMPRPLPSSFDPTEDLRRHGLLASLWLYALAERAKAVFPKPSRFSVSSAEPGNRNTPNIVVVQSESFFDVRRLFAGIRPELLREFDALRVSAVWQGQVEVPAWGANTARTEFAFLSALGAESLGVHRFNPYRKLARQGVPTLAGFLRHLGYRTVCMHPYAASFYSRDEAYPLLGFDEFIDIRSFDGAEKSGSYVCDVALAEKVCGLLGDSSSRPIFVFVITMENHGPLHLERVAPGDVPRLYTLPPPAGFDDLTVYLRHLGNADRMIGMLRERLERSVDDAWLCWYGDHVPILASVYEATGFTDGRTDYFIWGKGRAPEASAPRNLKVEDLGVLFLEQAGLLIKPPMNADNQTLE
jgi:hypothetical protein